MQQPDFAYDHYRNRSALVDATADVAQKMWSEVDPQKIVESWSTQIPELAATVTAAQIGSARAADPYVDEAAAWQDLPSESAPVNPAGFAGHASDGRSLLELLMSPSVQALQMIAAGMMAPTAVAHAGLRLDTIVRTQVSDAGRLADGASLTAHRAIDGYTRVVVGKTCNRCIILAGKHYKWNDGFKRHPRCDCIHLPTADAIVRKLVKDPRELFDRLSPLERKIAGWSEADQKAILAGSDIFQVTNAQRGVYLAGGREFTNVGTTRRALFGGYKIDPDTGRLTRIPKGQHAGPRLTPEQIYREAGDDRTMAIRLLRKNGYLLDTPAVERIPLPVAAAKDPALSMRVADLKSIARQNNVPIAGLTKKDEIVARLREFEAGNGRLAGLPEFTRPEIAPVLSVPKLAPPSRDLPILTGKSVDGWADLVPAKVPADGLRARHLEVLPDRAGKSYVVEHATVFRDGDVLYLVEHGADEYGSTKVAKALAEMRQAHASIPAAARANKSYSYLTRESPFDDYYRRKYNDPTHTASMSAGEGRVVMWNREKWPRVRETEVRHETGHNLDGLVGEKRGSGSPEWNAATNADTARAREIAEFDGRGRISLAVDESKDFPRGVTEYGKSSKAEDYAESVMMYQLGPIAKGRIPGEASVRDLYFRDIFPERAKILDREFPELAREQQAAVEALQRPGIKVSTKNSRTGQPAGYPKRQSVPDAKANWSTSYPRYDPPEYTAPSVLANDRTKKPGGWADPEDPRKVGREFHSSTGPIRVDERGRPINPMGRTGIQGRGLLGKWGPNQAADPIVTRINPRTGKLEIAVIKRGDTGDWAIPGGMVDDGEQLSAALARELREETGADLDMAGAREVYRGYVDDPRNTDNAWMETTVMHRHLTPQEAAKVEFGRGGLDTGEVRAIQWAEVDDEFLSHMYASHGEFIRAALKDRGVVGGKRSLDVEVVPAEGATTAAKAAAPAMSAEAADVVRAVKAIENRPGGWVPIADIRDRLPHMTRAQQDRALEELAQTPGAQLIPWDNRKALTSRDREAALRFGGDENHALRIEFAAPAESAARTATKAAKTVAEVPPEQRIRNLLAGKGTAPRIPTSGPLADGYAGATLDELRVLAEARYGHLGKIAPKASREQLLAALRSEVDLTDVNVSKREAARLLQLRVERGQALADILAEAAEQTFKRATPEAMRRSIEAIARSVTTARTPVPPAFLQGVLKAAQAGDRAKVEAALRRLGQKYKIRLDGMAGDVSKFREGMEATVGGGLTSGVEVRITRPGATIELPTGETRLRNAVVREVDAQEKARIRQEVIDEARKRAEVLTEVNELVANGASKSVIRERLDIRLKRVGLDADPDLKAFIRAVESGDPAKIAKASQAVAKKLNLTQLDEAGVLAKFDRTRFQAITGERIADGAQVRVVRPGFEFTLNGEKVTLSKPVVEALSDAEVAQIRQQAVDTARGLVDLSAELAGGPAQRRIAIEASALPDDVKAVLLAASRVSPAKLKTTLTAQLKKRGVTVAKAPKTPVKFDPKTMEVKGGGKLPVGTKVRVVEPEVTVVQQGETVVVRKAVVEHEMPNRAARELGELLTAGPATVRVEVQKAFDAPWPGGIRVEVTSVKVAKTGDRSITMSAKLVDQNGRKVGDMNGNFFRDAHGDLVAHHDYISINQDLQGSGFSNEFMANLFDWYARSGVKRVEVLANIDVGGYTWASQGFGFASDEARRRLARQVEQKLTRIREMIANPPPIMMTSEGPYSILAGALSGMTEAEFLVQAKLFDQILARIAAGEEISPYEISQIGRKAGQGGKAAMWIGKLLMLGSRWDGAILL